MKHLPYITLFPNLIFFLLFIQVAQAQRYNFRTWSLAEGLPQSQVFELMQDSRGILWMGTNGGGLTRFDGKNFETFTTEDGLANNQIRQIIEAKDGHLWIFTLAGLSRFDGHTFKNYGEEEGLKILNFCHGFEDKKGRIWYANNFNQQVGYLENDTLVDITQKYPELSHNQVFRSIFILHSGRILIDTRQGLYHYENDSLSWSPLNNLFKDSIQIIPFFETSDNKLFCVVSPVNQRNNFVPKIINLQTNTLEEYPDTLLSALNNVRDIYEDRQGILWFGLGNAGLVRFDGKQVQTFTEANGLASNSIRSITKDREGNIWLGTNGSGLVKYTESPWTIYQEQHGLNAGFVWSILEKKDGNIWLGTSEGIVSYDGQKFEHFITQKGRNEMGILHQIVEKEDGNLLLGTYTRGLYEFDGKEAQLVNEKYGLQPISLGYLMKDNDDLWLFQNQTLIRHQTEKTTIFTTDQTHLNGLASHILKAKNGDIWFSMNNGIGRYNGKKFRIFTDKDGLKNVNIMQATEDNFGRIWFATFGEGLIQFDGKKFHPFTQQQGLSSNTIYSITTDNQGNIWAGTQLGATKISLTQTGEIKTIENFGKNDGFWGVETNGKAILCDSKGNIWVGTIGGLQKYSPEKVISDSVPPQVRLKEIQLFMKKTNWKSNEFQEFCELKNPFNVPQNLVLPYDKNHLTFRFESSSFRVPEKVRYQWKLDGVDKDWSPITDKHEAVYAHLAPNFYVFHVRTMNDQGVWSKELTYAFRITPPIWERWWFLTFSFCGVMGLVITGVRLREKHRIKVIKEKNEKLEHTVKLRTLELTEKNAELEQQQEEILAQNDHINDQNQELQRKNENITASINYAKRIQQAILPFEERIQAIFPEHFILFKPKNIVSGDFYWFQQIDNQKFIISALDCTGHGVPGAFMSMVGDAILNQVVLDKHIDDADEILNALNQGIRLALRQENSGNQDGMDASLCVINYAQKIMQFAGAKNPLYYVQDAQMNVIKGDRMPIGGSQYSLKQKFTRHNISFEKPIVFYIFSDGYQDQFGGVPTKKFMAKHFRELLFSISEKPVIEQCQILEETLQTWMQNQEQIDDILVIGGRIGG